jgi:uncharacterized membrane protein (UPF0127 family)
MRLYKESGMDVRGDALIELPSGTIRKSRTEIGDQLEIFLAETSELDDLTYTRLSQIA